MTKKPNCTNKSIPPPKFFSFLHQENPDSDKSLLVRNRVLDHAYPFPEVEIGMIGVKSGFARASFFVTIEGLLPDDRTVVLVRPILSPHGKARANIRWQEIDSKDKQFGCVGSIDGLCPDTDYEYLVLIRNRDGHEVAGPEIGHFQTSPRRG